jgi:hypothetical protein
MLDWKEGNMRTVIVAAIVLLISLPSLAHRGSHSAEEDVFTLYRSGVSLVDSTMSTKRFHVATFDAFVGGFYDEENCAIARDLFRSQPGVTVAYWCELGYVKDED